MSSTVFKAAMGGAGGEVPASYSIKFIDHSSVTRAPFNIAVNDNTTLREVLERIQEHTNLPFYALRLQAGNLQLAFMNPSQLILQILRDRGVEPTAAGEFILENAPPDFMTVSGVTLGFLDRKYVPIPEEVGKCRAELPSSLEGLSRELGLTCPWTDRFITGVPVKINDQFYDYHGFLQYLTAQKTEAERSSNKAPFYIDPCGKPLQKDFFTGIPSFCQRLNEHIAVGMYEDRVLALYAEAAKPADLRAHEKRIRAEEREEFILVDVDDTLLLNPGLGYLPEYNEALIDALVSSGMTDIFPFSQGDFSLQMIAETKGTIQHLESKGLNVLGVVTRHDFFWHLDPAYLNALEDRWFRHLRDMDCIRVKGEGCFLTAEKDEALLRMINRNFSSVLPLGWAYEEALKNLHLDLTERIRTCALAEEICCANWGIDRSKYPSLTIFEHILFYAQRFNKLRKIVSIDDREDCLSGGRVMCHALRYVKQIFINPWKNQLCPILKNQAELEKELQGTVAEARFASMAAIEELLMGTAFTCVEQVYQGVLVELRDAGRLDLLGQLVDSDPRVLKFRAHYRDQYNSEKLKFESAMSTLILGNRPLSWAEVLKHAHENPSSRTAEVLRSMGVCESATSLDEKGLFSVSSVTASAGAGGWV